MIVPVYNLHFASLTIFVDWIAFYQIDFSDDDFAHIFTLGYQSYLLKIYLNISFFFYLSSNIFFHSTRLLYIYHINYLIKSKSLKC